MYGSGDNGTETVISTAERNGVHSGQQYQLDSIWPVRLSASQRAKYVPMCLARVSGALHSAHCFSWSSFHCTKFSVIGALYRAQSVLVGPFHCTEIRTLEFTVFNHLLCVKYIVSMEGSVVPSASVQKSSELFPVLYVQLEHPGVLSLF